MASTSRARKRFYSDFFKPENTGTCYFVPKCSYRWTIKDFSPSTKSLSHSFKGLFYEEEFDFIIDLNPVTSFGSTVDKGYINIDLTLISKHEQEFTIVGTMAIVNFRNEVIHSMTNFMDNSIIKSYTTDHNRIPLQFSKFIPRVEIFSRHDCLHEGVLIIRCDIALRPLMKQPGSSLRMKNSVNVVDPKPLLWKGIESLFDTDKLSDFVIRVKGREYRVHKAILGAHSPVFAAMFQQDMLEKSQNCVDIIDFESEVIGEMLRFLYTGEAKLHNLVDDLFSLAEKYAIDSLKEVTEDFLLKNTTVETVTRILNLADLHDAVKLKEHCINFICDHASDVVDTASWLAIAKDKPSLIVGVFTALAKRQKAPVNNS